MNQKQAPLHFPCRGACFFLVIQPERGGQGTVLCLLSKRKSGDKEPSPVPQAGRTAGHFPERFSEGCPTPENHDEDFFF